MGFTKWTARKAQALSVGARKAKEQQVVPSNQQEAAGTASPAPKAAPAVPDERGPWRQRKGRGAAPVRGADSTAGAGCDDQQCVEEPSAVEFVAEDVQAEAHTPRSSAPPAPPSSSPAARALAVLGSTVSAAAGAAVDAISVDVLALPGEVAADVGVAAVLAAGVASAALGPVAAAAAAPVAAAAAALGLAGRVALRRSERKRKQPEAVEEAHARPQPPQQSSPPPDVAALAASWESEDMLWEEGSTVPARAPGQFSDTAQRTPQAAYVIVTLGGSPAAVAYTFEPGESEDPASLGQHRSLLVDVSPLCDQLSLAVPWRWRDRDGVVKVNFQVGQRLRGGKLFLTHKTRLLVLPWRVVEWLQALDWASLTNGPDEQQAEDRNRALFGLLRYCVAAVAGRPLAATAGALSLQQPSLAGSEALSALLSRGLLSLSAAYAAACKAKGSLLDVQQFSSLVEDRFPDLARCLFIIWGRNDDMLRSEGRYWLALMAITGALHSQHFGGARGELSEFFHNRGASFQALQLLSLIGLGVSPSTLHRRLTVAAEQQAADALALLRAGASSKHRAVRMDNVIWKSKVGVQREGQAYLMSNATSVAFKEVEDDTVDLSLWYDDDGKIINPAVQLGGFPLSALEPGGVIDNLCNWYRDTRSKQDLGLEYRDQLLQLDSVSLRESVSYDEDLLALAADGLRGTQPVNLVGINPNSTRIVIDVLMKLMAETEGQERETYLVMPTDLVFYKAHKVVQIKFWDPILEKLYKAITLASTACRSKNLWQMVHVFITAHRAFESCGGRGELQHAFQVVEEDDSVPLEVKTGRLVQLQILAAFFTFHLPAALRTLQVYIAMMTASTPEERGEWFDRYHEEVLPLFAVLALHWDCSNFAPYLCVEKITLDALKAIQSEAYEMWLYTQQ
ncbi:hypothetical protein N2152v2_003137 [Parachlorella kessleri]